MENTLQNAKTYLLGRITTESDQDDVAMVLFQYTSACSATSSIGEDGGLKSFDSWVTLWNDWKAQRSELDGFFEFRRWVETNYHTPRSYAEIRVAEDKNTIRAMAVSLKEAEAEYVALQSELSEAKERIKELKRIYYLINNGDLNQEGLTLYYAVGETFKNK